MCIKCRKHHHDLDHCYDLDALVTPSVKVVGHHVKQEPGATARTHSSTRPALNSASNTLEYFTQTTI